MITIQSFLNHIEPKHHKKWKNFVEKLNLINAMEVVKRCLIHLHNNLCSKILIFYLRKYQKY